MNASTHVLFGMASWGAFERLYGVNVLSAPETMLIAGFSSLLPDIDHPQSRFGRMIPFISYPISAIFGHRGVTHSLFMAIMLLVGLLIYGKTLWMLPPVVVGYLSHLVGDVLTNSGAPLLWPQKGKVSIPVFNTGSFVEPFVRALLFVALLGIAWQDVGLSFR